MKIGFDFDNTIVCYDKAITTLSDVIELPKKLTRNRLFIRDYLKAQNREFEWTKFQGLLYGPGMKYAKPYEFFIEVAKNLILNSNELFIISHRTRYPYAGKKFDLHKEANFWINKNINDPIIIKQKNIFFEETIEKKINKIDELKIDIYIDDLISIINHENFPAHTKTVLFDPNNINIIFQNKISNWKEFLKYV